MPLSGPSRALSVPAALPPQRPADHATAPVAPPERHTLGSLLGMPLGAMAARAPSAPGAAAAAPMPAPPVRRTLGELLGIPPAPAAGGAAHGAPATPVPAAASAPGPAAEAPAVSLPAWVDWLQAPAAAQYLHAKALAPAQRALLAQTLEAIWRKHPDLQAPSPEMNLWMSVMKAQLRARREIRHDAGRLAQAGQRVLSLLRACAPLDAGVAVRDGEGRMRGPEYRAAFNHLLRVIGDESLAQPLRDAAERALQAHRENGATLTPDHAARLSREGIVVLAEQGYRAIGAGALHKATPPHLRSELRAPFSLWLEAQEAFDGEENAPAFAHLLERRLPSTPALRKAHGPGATLLQEGAQVIQAIARDGRLRARVLAMAENALGSCGDNVAEGFSAIVLAVRNHQMAQAVQEGRIDAAGLDGWARQQFRLGALEAAVHHFIRQALETPGVPEDMERQLRREPLETMLHAKVSLKALLWLPDSVPSEMTYAAQSVLTPGDLSALAAGVMDAESDDWQLTAYLLSNETWRVGMRHLHRGPFAALDAAFDEDPFHDRDLPRDGDAHVQERVAYNVAAAEFMQRQRAAEDALLLQRWGGVPG
ncbi:NEL domain-containing protein [Acidovorax sp. GBBC 1281]|uniref:NEL-type E3 ubiquitin ligase domain-containing protein n=1 Tax=unclassified Acidovorax TaxID=2684926 RepID=UPI0023491AA5|nr:MULTISPECIES: NEL-type E3 ubiquitin ligase domain-containing protein [unclassified Acidovorax]WCM97680.1 NEL domain-containing protein [Acidovorax sp. GBBC 1281]